MPVYLFNADSASGYFEIVDTDFPTANEANSSTTFNTASNPMYASCNYASPNYTIRRMGLVFDTTTIPTDEIVISVAIKFGQVAQSPTMNGGKVILTNWTASDPTAPAVSDFGSFLSSTIISVEKAITAGYVTIPIIEEYNTVINKEGFTNIGVMITLDYQQTQPTGNNQYGARRPLDANYPPIIQITTADKGYVYLRGAVIKGATFA